MSLSAFMAQNAVQTENQKLVVSNRFLDEAGKPIPWEIRALSEEEDAELKRVCTVKTISKGRQITFFDNQRYMNMLVALSVAYPDLKDAELQKSYGVTSDTSLIQKMLIAGEYLNLQQAVNEINGFDAEKAEEAKDEVKNS